MWQALLGTPSNLIPFHLPSANALSCYTLPRAPRRVGAGRRCARDPYPAARVRPPDRGRGGEEDVISRSMKATDAFPTEPH